MRRISGMTLIELMMVLAVLALLVAIALPSYQGYLARGIRSQGQQFLMDIAQSQEQFFLDQRAYATALGAGAGLLNRTVPPEVAAHYTLTMTVSNAAGAPPTFLLQLDPTSTTMTPDGRLVLNNLQQRWREIAGGNLTFDGAPNDCTWDKGTCVAQ
jgi:type IV pilus assembly protein PilE